MLQIGMGLISLASGTWYAIDDTDVASAPVLFRSIAGDRSVGVTCLDAYEDIWKSYPGEVRRRVVHRFASSFGNTSVEPGSRSIYTFERIARSTHRLVDDVNGWRTARGFEGITLFGSLDGASTIVVGRFAEFDAGSREARYAPAAHAAEARPSYVEMRPVRTLGIAPRRFERAVPETAVRSTVRP